MDMKKLLESISQFEGLDKQGVAEASNDLDEKAINPYAVGMAAAMKSTGDKPPLKKSTIKKAHKIAKKVDESLTVTATDNDAYSLMRMVSLSGVPGAAKVEPLEPYSPYSKPVGGVIYDGGCSAVNCSDSNCPTHGHGMMPMEEYANEPNEETCEVSSVTDDAGLGGLNGSKKQYPGYHKADNPLTDNADIEERATKLASMYNKFKGK